ncbi:MAG: hypothetical protein EPO22_13200 [Dehalococcoidia bacterium]|nr:MAG: hypothetical protein EPO22_13200 [Dehalococcoidia bacterium]
MTPDAYRALLRSQGFSDAHTDLELAEIERARERHLLPERVMPTPAREASTAGVVFDLLLRRRKHRRHHSETSPDESAPMARHD